MGDNTLKKFFTLLSMLHLNENADIHLLRMLNFELKAHLSSKISVMGHTDKKFTKHKLQQKLYE